MNNPPQNRRYAVITPVRDEARTLPQTIASMLAQTVRPRRWVIVDDGSTDETPEIAAQAASQHDWIRVVRQENRGHRKVGGGVVVAFNAGLRTLEMDEYRYICKLDGDLVFGPDMFVQLMSKMENDPRLGSCSGKCWDRHGEKLVLLRMRDDHSCGACKFYRTSCFQEIGGFVEEVMWDGIDVHRCRMLGWHAASFHDEDLRIIELRPMGSSQRSILHGRFRWGYGQYFMGTHPLYALAIATYRLFEYPWIIGGMMILAGYVEGFIRGRPRYEDPAFRKYLQNWQLTRLRLRKSVSK